MSMEPEKFEVKPWWSTYNLLDWWSDRIETVFYILGIIVFLRMLGWWVP